MRFIKFMPVDSVIPAQAGIHLRFIKFTLIDSVIPAQAGIHTLLTPLSLFSTIRTSGYTLFDGSKMHDPPVRDFLTTALDPDLLSTPFGVQTNWHVITGATCSGKTTLIDQLSARGFRTVPETARLYLEVELARGRTIDEIRQDAITLERALIAMQLRFERALPATDIVFLDRGLPDGLPFCRVAGLDPNLILSECFHHRYASIFILDRFLIQQDDCRIEEETTADFLDEWLVRDYTALGYNVVRVPVMSPEERLAFTLEQLSERGPL
jgi:predicted ATPase